MSKNFLLFYLLDDTHNLVFSFHQKYEYKFVLWKYHYDQEVLEQYANLLHYSINV